MALSRSLGGSLDHVLTASGRGTPPVIVNAGLDATLVTEDPVALTGAATGGTPPYTYLWTVVSKPIGSTATFEDDTDPLSDFTPEDANGDFVLRLTATDAAARTASDDVTKTLAVPP